MYPERLIVATAVALTSAAFTDVKPAQLFSNNMVIQGEIQAPAWGWANAGEKVTLSGSWRAEASTTAGENGKWISFCLGT